MRPYLTALIFCLATNFAFTEEESWILFKSPNFSDTDYSKNSSNVNSATDAQPLLYNGTITLNLNVNTCQSIDGRIVYPIEESNYHEIFGERK